MAADYKMTIDEFVTMKNKLRAELERRGGGTAQSLNSLQS